MEIRLDELNSTISVDGIIAVAGGTMTPEIGEYLEKRISGFRSAIFAEQIEYQRLESAALRSPSSHLYNQQRRRIFLVHILELQCRHSEELLRSLEAYAALLSTVQPS